MSSETGSYTSKYSSKANNSKNQIGAYGHNKKVELQKDVMKQQIHIDEEREIQEEKRRQLARDNLNRRNQKEKKIQEDIEKKKQKEQEVLQQRKQDKQGAYMKYLRANSNKVMDEFKGLSKNGTKPSSSGSQQRGQNILKQPSKEKVVYPGQLNLKNNYGLRTEERMDKKKAPIKEKKLKQWGNPIKSKAQEIDDDKNLQALDLDMKNSMIAMEKFKHNQQITNNQSLLKLSKAGKDFLAGFEVNLEDSDDEDQKSVKKSQIIEGLDLSRANPSLCKKKKDLPKTQQSQFELIYQQILGKVEGNKKIFQTQKSVEKQNQLQQAEEVESGEEDEHENEEQEGNQQNQCIDGLDDSLDEGINYKIQKIEKNQNFTEKPKKIKIFDEKPTQKQASIQEKFEETGNLKEMIENMIGFEGEENDDWLNKDYTKFNIQKAKAKEEEAKRQLEQSKDKQQNLQLKKEYSANQDAFDSKLFGEQAQIYEQTQTKLPQCNLLEWAQKNEQQAEDMFSEIGSRAGARKKQSVNEAKEVKSKPPQPPIINVNKQQNEGRPTWNTNHTRFRDTSQQKGNRQQSSEKNSARVSQQQQQLQQVSQSHSPRQNEILDGSKDASKENSPQQKQVQIVTNIRSTQNNFNQKEGQKQKQEVVANGGVQQQQQQQNKEQNVSKFKNKLQNKLEADKRINQHKIDQKGVKFKGKKDLSPATACTRDTNLDLEEFIKDDLNNINKEEMTLQKEIMNLDMNNFQIINQVIEKNNLKLDYVSSRQLSNFPNIPKISQNEVKQYAQKPIQEEDLQSSIYRLDYMLVKQQDRMQQPKQKLFVNLQKNLIKLQKEETETEEHVYSQQNNFQTREQYLQQQETQQHQQISQQQQVFQQQQAQNQIQQQSYLLYQQYMLQAVQNPQLMTDPTFMQKLQNLAQNANLPENTQKSNQIQVSPVGNQNNIDSVKSPQFAGGVKEEPCKHQSPKNNIYHLVQSDVSSYAKLRQDDDQKSQVSRVSSKFNKVKSRDQSQDVEKKSSELGGQKQFTFKQLPNVPPQIPQDQRSNISGNSSNNRGYRQQIFEDEEMQNEFMNTKLDKQKKLEFWNQATTTATSEEVVLKKQKPISRGKEQVVQKQNVVQMMNDLDEEMTHSFSENKENIDLEQTEQSTYSTNNQNGKGQKVNNSYGQQRKAKVQKDDKQDKNRNDHQGQNEDGGIKINKGVDLKQLLMDEDD